MPKEFETRIRNINIEEIDKRLMDLGAEKTPTVLQKRWTFDFPGRPLEKKRAWVRIRDTGDGKLWMAYKNHKITKKAVADCDEVEFEIKDEQKAIAFLEALGMKQKSYQETRRTRYELNNLEFDLDEWPMIDPFIEIEGESEESVMNGVELLGFSKSDTFQGHAGDIYEDEGIKWRAMKRIVFDE
jgi:adenylate cyclase class 2